MKRNHAANRILVLSLLAAALLLGGCDGIFFDDGDEDLGINERGGYIYLLDNESSRIVMLDRNLIERGSWPYAGFTAETYAQGLTLDATGLWVSVAGGEDRLIQLDLSAGPDPEVVRSLPAPPDGGGTVRDLAWDGENLWVLNSGSATYTTPPEIFRVDPLTGEVLARYPLPSAEPRGLCFVGANADVYGAGIPVGCYYTDKDDDLVHVFNTERGIFLDGFAVPVPPRGVNYVYANGIFFDGETFWSTNSSGVADHVFQLQASGVVIQRMDLTYGQPGALVWSERDLSVPAPPMVLEASPNTGGPGAHKAVTLTGSGFRDGPGLTADFGEAVTVDSLRFESSLALTVHVTIDPDAGLGSRDVTVTNPDGQSGTGTGLFTVVEDDPSLGSLWVTDYVAGALHRYSINDRRWVASYAVDPVAPDASPQGLAFDGSRLWLSASGSDDLIASFDTTGGVLTGLAEFSAPPDGAGTVRDLAFDGSAIWAANSSEMEIYRMDPLSGTILSTIPTPGAEARGLAWADGRLFCNDKDIDSVFVWNPDVERWSSVFAAPVPPGGSATYRFPTGMTWDGYNFWMCNSSGDFDYIFQVSPEGTLLGTVEVPNRGTAQLTGLVYTQP